MSDIYLSITETPAVVTLSQPVISSSVAATVTVGNTVTVALDANSLSALENVTVTVGAAVSVSNFPASQVVTGSVAVTTMPALSISSVTVSNLGLVPSSVATDGTADGTLNFVKIGGHQSGSNQTAHIVHVSAGGSMSVDATDSVVSISNFPSTQTIAGTVTANVLGRNANYTSGVTALQLPIIGYDETIETADAGVVVPVQITNTLGVVGGSNALPISGTVTANVPYQDINAGIADWVVSTNDPIPVAPFGGTLPISGTVTANNPSGALTTRFGSVTTANTAQITSAVTNTSRKYLLAQNISAGTVTIGIGFSPTTTQGIQLTAGAGLTFDSFCPTGAVFWLGAVTGAAFTILEG